MRERRANMPGAMTENLAPPLMAIVAPVKMSVPLAPVSGLGELDTKKGRTLWAKLNPEMLLSDQRPGLLVPDIASERRG